ncbi:MAG: 5'-methylthioadenosine/S-adenosylhomocysteine nucleosidase [Lachnospiraceae bacterium]|nr:5'-methylthioadenosine/S-adenosylhomocysteine nucleosidase [Lachnospiraceae bacterium]
MVIGLVIAIERELQAFLADGGSVETVRVGRREAYHAKRDGHELYAVMSGWGEIDAASATQFLITAFDCEVVMNFGVAGALRRELAVKDLFVVRGAINYDFDTSCIDPVAPHQYAEYPSEIIPLDTRLIETAMRLRPDVKPAVVASGERFIEASEEKTALASLGCDICDMEIAAIARVAERNGVRAFSVKCISDTFDGDGNDFQKNVKAGAEKAFALLSEIIKNCD